MTRLITFSDDNMIIAANICKASALQNNVHEVKVYGRKDIDQKFRKANAAILDQPRGCGYWLWKPYLIDRELKKMKDGEYLIYCDAGVEIINNVNHIIDRMRGDVWLFGNKFQHVHWCKADVIDAILGGGWVMDEKIKQVQASVVILRASETSRSFVQQWLKYCCNKQLIDDGPSIIQNHPEFQENRHDQSILTTLAYYHNMDFHWWPAMYNAGNFTYEKTGYADTYPVLFHHHRLRNNEFSATDDLSRHMQRYFKQRYPNLL
jgi:hypothetical protein